MDTALAISATIIEILVALAVPWLSYPAPVPAVSTRWGSLGRVFVLPSKLPMTHALNEGR